MQQFAAVDLEDVEHDQMGGQFLREAGRAAVAGDRAPLQPFERHPLPRPHDQFAVEDQAVGQIRRGRVHQLGEAGLDQAAPAGLEAPGPGNSSAR